jgi:hypothetical protein
MPNPIRFHSLNTDKRDVSGAYPTLTVNRVGILSELIRHSEDIPILDGKYLASLKADTGDRIARLSVVALGSEGRTTVLEAGISWWNESSQRRAFKAAERLYINASDIVHRHATPAQQARYSLLCECPDADGTPYVGYHMAKDDPELEHHLRHFIHHLVIRLKSEFCPRS